MENFQRDFRFEPPRLPEVVSNCSVAFFDTRSESSGIFYCLIPVGGIVDGRNKEGIGLYAS